MTIQHTQHASSRLRSTGEFVDRTTRALQSGYLRKPRPDPSDVAMLARLRRAAGKPLAECPEVWEATLGAFPVNPGDDEPTETERAAHTALTLYALHQQSRREPMHRAGARFGAAVRRLANVGRSEQAVRRRFVAIGTAVTYGEAERHLRGLVAQLRDESIPLDYGLLADQLVSLQDPVRAARVRLAWGRDFYRKDSRSEHDDASTDTENATEEH